jgi:toxin ParE1/3/4
MAELRITHQAIDDLRLIWNYTFDEWSMDQADKYYGMLIGSCKSIAQSPGLGREYAEVSKGLYGMKAGRHIIFYRVSDDQYVLIVRILHERMDLKRRIFS